MTDVVFIVNAIAAPLGWEERIKQVKADTVERKFVVRALEIAIQRDRDELRKWFGHAEARGTESQERIEEALIEIIESFVALKPDWRRAQDDGDDKDRLYFDGEVVRVFGARAKNSKLLLDAFQEEGWPRRMDNSLPQSADLSEAIRTLNSNLTRIRFERDGRGEGIVWRVLE